MTEEAPSRSPFGLILQAMVERIPGAIGAIFADWEGEAIDQFAHLPAIEIKLIGAHWGVVLQQVAERLHKIGAGPVAELVVDCQEAVILVVPVTERYFVVLEASRAVHLGTARREVERSAHTLLGEV
jgi:predicted regulator of Ras-like GTPase activity (Roadblock/LC7/MglB family)